MVASGPPTCKNCGETLSEVLRCSQCKRATYCSAKCAKSDWAFHKRTCEKPKGGVTGGAPAPPAPAPAAAPPAPAPRSSGSDEVELDEEERMAVEELRKAGGYKVHYRSKEDAARWKEAVGEIKHDRVEAASAPVAVDAGAAAASAWNTAGTLEQKHLGPWVRTRLAQVLSEARRAGQLAAGPLVVSDLSGWGDSSADVLIRAGKVRHVYDLSFVISLALVAGEGADAPVADVTLDGAAGGALLQLHFTDVSNTSEGQGRDVRVTYSDSFPEAQRSSPGVLAAQAALLAEVRGAVEAVVREFKAK